MTGYVLLALLFLATTWFELSGTGPRWRAWLEETSYQWTIRKKGGRFR